MASTTKPAKRTTARQAARTAESAELDNALYTPRLDQVSMTESAMEGAGPDYAAILESICGVSDDSQAVEQYDGTLGVTTAFVNAHEQPVAQVQWNDNLAAVFTNPGDVNGIRWGGGTMIGPDLFLTCGHLFDQNPDGWTVPRQNGTSTAISPQDIALNMRLNFNYQVDAGGTLRAEQRFPITQLIEYRLGALDMALCRVGGNPGNIYGWTEVSTTNAAVGDMIAIVGHPAGQPKRIEAGPMTEVSGTTVRYNDIDTLGGNSGSGILHGPTGRVVGVHTNGGCNSAGTGSNSGVAIAAIRGVSPTLQALPQGSSTGQGADFFGTALAADVHGTSFGADTVSAQDNLATHLAADVKTTLHAADTISALDQLQTSLAADVVGTIHAADTGLSDVLGTGLAGDIGTFAGGDDPNITRVEGIFDPGQIVFDPGPLFNRFLAGRLRPFVQAGPYTPVGGETSQQSTGEVILTELEGAIAAQTAVLASLQAVYAALHAAATAQV